jgi:hypothetical protein
LGVLWAAFRYICEGATHPIRSFRRERTAGERAIAAYASAVIEIMRFRLPPGADEAAFLAADRRVQEEFASCQPGLLRRTTARGQDGGWIVIDLWRSAADADACDARWELDPVTQGFMARLDRSSVTTERYQERD